MEKTASLALEDNSLDLIIEGLKKLPLVPKEERESLSREYLNEMLNNIYTTYETIEKQEQKTELIKNSDISLNHFIQKNDCLLHRKIIYTQMSTGQKFELTHLKVHQQFVGNLCGYYAIFYIKESLKMIKSQNLSEYFNLLNSAHFWRFHFKATRFLQKYAKEMKFDSTKTPWTTSEIRWGDLERSYVEPLLTHFPELRDVLENTSLFEIKVFNYQFQFKRFMNSLVQMQQMQAHIDKVRLSTEKNKHYLTFFMMGITNHWVMFCAHKFNERIEFWYMDSRNRDYLLWTEEEIQRFYPEENERRKKHGRKPWNPFQIWVHVSNVIDIQISLKLLVDCFLGNTSLYQYSAEGGYKIIRNELLDALMIQGIEYPKTTQDFEKAVAGLTVESFKALLLQFKQFISAYGQSIKELITVPEKFNYLTLSTIEDLRLMLAIGRIIIEDKRNTLYNNLIAAFKANVLELKF